MRTQPQLNLTRSPYAAFLQLHFHLPTAINLSHPNFSATILMIERKVIGVGVGQQIPSLLWTLGCNLTAASSV